MGPQEKVWQEKELKKWIKQYRGLVGEKEGCFTGLGEVCGGPLEEAAVAAPPSSPVSPA